MRVCCDMCGAEGAKIRHGTRSYGQGADRLVIENVPIVSCAVCRRSYLTGETLREIENLRREYRSLAEKEEAAIDRARHLHGRMDVMDVDE